jgi:phage/plasmid-associated DNA primase
MGCPWLSGLAMRWSYPPEIVRRATGDYRTEMDTIGEFVQERCVILPTASARGNALYAAYQDWCAATGERPISNRQFGSQLGARAEISKLPDDKGVRYEGIRLRQLAN